MANTARAAVMTAAGRDLEIKAYPLPTVDQGCILVRITCCTICGSAVHSWMGCVLPIPARPFARQFCRDCL
jgi:D-arabinose 1-dehydrogenase-like Zn-dependent alcohol dehydrogenase